MAVLHRIALRALVAALLVLSSPFAAASFPATAGFNYAAASMFGEAVTTGTSAGEACNKKPAAYVAAGGSQPLTVVSVTETVCTVKVGTGSPVAGAISKTAANFCPSNSTLSGSTCTCSSGYLESGATCISQQASDNANCANLSAGLNLVGAPMVHFGAAGLTACFGGYVMSGTGAASGGGQTELYGPFKCTGENASSCSVVPKPSSITATCPAGSYPGTVNGVQVCVPPSSSVEAPKTTTAIPPSPGASAPSIPGAPAGTTTEEKQTVCDGPTCTVTTTYKDGSGTSTGSKTEAQSKADYCSDNPKAPGCDSLTASAFSGSCVSGFVGKGDALQKATAEAVNKMNCLIDPGTTTEPVKAELEAGTFGPPLVNRNITVAQFDQTNPFGSSCPPDFQISLGSMLGSHTVPLSQMCTFLALLGYIALGVTLISSTVFVVRGFK